MGFVLQVKGSMWRPGKPTTWKCKCVVNNVWMQCEQGRTPRNVFWMWNVNILRFTNCEFIEVVKVFPHPSYGGDSSKFFPKILNLFYNLEFI